MEINQAEKVLKALANRRRLKIIKYVARNGRATVSELAEHLNLSFKSTSKHIAVLKNADVVDSEQISLSRFYTLTRPMSSLTKEIIFIV